MSVVGFQDYWAVGSRFLFKRDDDGATTFPWIDLGTIEPVNLSSDITSTKLEDSDGGRKVTVAESVVAIDESYEVQGSNFNMENLALIFLGSAPEAWSQTAVDQDVQHAVFNGQIAKLVDPVGAEVFGLDSIEGIASGNSDLGAGTLTNIVAATKTLTVTEDLSSLSAGDQVVIRGTGLSDINNAGTYTLASTPVYTSSSAVVVVEALSSDETAITGTLTYEAGTDVIYNKGTDWSAVSTARGIVEILSTGAITDGNVNIFYHLAARSGKEAFEAAKAEGRS